MTGNVTGLVDLLKGVFAQEAIVAEGLDVQETSAGLEADLPNCGQVLEKGGTTSCTYLIEARATRNV